MWEIGSFVYRFGKDFQSALKGTVARDFWEFFSSTKSPSCSYWIFPKTICNYNFFVELWNTTKNPCATVFLKPEGMAWSMRKKSEQSKNNLPVYRQITKYRHIFDINNFFFSKSITHSMVFFSDRKLTKFGAYTEIGGGNMCCQNSKSTGTIVIY